MKNNNKNLNGRKCIRREGRIRGIKNGGRRVKNGGVDSNRLARQKPKILPYQFEGIYILKSYKEFYVTKNLCPGKSSYGEELISIENNNQIENNEENSINKEEYRIWNTFNSKFGSSIEKGFNNIYIKPESKILYLGAGNDSYSTISHISDIVGENGVIYAVEISEIRGLTLKNMAKNRKNIVSIIKDARKPFNYKDYIPTFIDCIFSDISEPDQAKIIGMNAQFFLKNKGGFVTIINANTIESSLIPLEEKLNEQIKLLRENNLYVKEFISLDNIGIGYSLLAGIYKSFRDNLEEEEDE